MTDHDRLPLKVFVHRVLIRRLVLAGAIIATALTGIAFFSAYDAIGRRLIESAHTRVEFLLFETRRILAAEAVAPETAFRRAFEQIADLRLRPSAGRFVYVSFYRPDGAEILEKSDKDYGRLQAVTRYVGGMPRRYPPLDEPWHELVWFGTAPHIHIVIAVPGRENQIIGYADGVVAVSDQTRIELWEKLLVVLLAVILITVAATALLYPVILTLTERLAVFSANLLAANLESLELLGGAIAKRDSDTDAHNYRVTIYAVRLAEAVGLSPRQIQGLIKGAFLHDVGKIGIRDHILLKPGKLTEPEFAIMKTHIDHGLDIVARSQWLQDTADVVGSHQEKFDGSGYPKQLRGDAIPVTARIFTVADVFDALTSCRPYKEPFTFEASMEILAQGRGSHFDPALVDAFARIARPLWERLGGREDETSKEELRAIVRAYFTGGLDTLMY